MAGGVSGDVDHAYVERRARDAHAVAVVQALRQMLDSLASRAVDGYRDARAIVRTASEQVFDAADVVVMMVRE